MLSCATHEQTLRDATARPQELTINSHTGPARPSPLLIHTTSQPQTMITTERDDSPCGSGLRRVLWKLQDDGTYSREMMNDNITEHLKETKSPSSSSPSPRDVWRGVQEIIKHQFEINHIVQYACKMNNNDAATAWATERELAVVPNVLFAYFSRRTDQELENIATVEKMRRQQSMTDCDGDETNETELNKRFPPSLAERRWQVRLRTMRAREQVRGTASMTSVSTKTTTTATPSRSTVSVDVTSSGAAMSVAMSAGADAHSNTPAIIASSLSSSSSSSSSYSQSQSDPCGVMTSFPSTNLPPTSPIITTTSSMTTMPGPASADAVTTSVRKPFSPEHPFSLVFITSPSRRASEATKLPPLTEEDEPNEWVRMRTTVSETIIERFHLAWQRPESTLFGLKGSLSIWNDEVLQQLMQKSGKAAHGVNATQRRIQLTAEQDALAQFIVDAGVIADEDTKMTAIAAIVAAPTTLWPEAFEAIDNQALSDLVINRWRRRSGAAKKIRVFNAIVSQLLQLLWTNFFARPATERRVALLKYNQRQYPLFNRVYDEELREFAVRSKLDNARLLMAYPFLQAAGMVRYADILSLDVINHVHHKAAKGEDVSRMCAAIVSCCIRRGADIRSFLNRKHSSVKDLSKSGSAAWIDRDVVREDMIYHGSCPPPNSNRPFQYRDVRCGFNWTSLPDELKAWSISEQSREYAALWANAEGRIGDCPSREALVARWQLELMTHAQSHANCVRFWPSADAKQHGDHLCRFGVMDDPTFFDFIDVHRRRDGRRTEYRVIYKSCQETNAFDPQWRTADESGMPDLVKAYNKALTSQEVANNTKHSRRFRNATMPPRMGTSAAFPAAQQSPQSQRRSVGSVSSSEDDSEASTPKPSSITTSSPTKARRRRSTTSAHHTIVTATTSTPTRASSTIRATTPTAQAVASATKPSSMSQAEALALYPIGAVLTDTRALLPSVRIISEAERTLALITHIRTKGDGDHVVNAILEARRNDPVWRTIDGSLLTTVGVNRTGAVNAEFERRASARAASAATPNIDQNMPDVSPSIAKHRVVTPRSAARVASWLDKPLIKAAEPAETKATFRKEWLRNDIYALTHDIQSFHGKPVTPALTAALTNSNVALSDDREPIPVCNSSVGSASGAQLGSDAIRADVNDGRNGANSSSRSTGTSSADQPSRSSAGNDDCVRVLAGQPTNSLDIGRTSTPTVEAVGASNIQTRIAEARNDDAHGQPKIVEQARSISDGRVATQPIANQQSSLPTLGNDGSDAVRSGSSNNAFSAGETPINRPIDATTVVASSVCRSVDGRLDAQSTGAEHPSVQPASMVQGRATETATVTAHSHEYVRADGERTGGRVETLPHRSDAAVVPDAAITSSRSESTASSGEVSARNHAARAEHDERTTRDVAAASGEARRTTTSNVRRFSYDNGRMGIRGEPRRRSLDCGSSEEQTSATALSRRRSRSQAPEVRRHVQFDDDCDVVSRQSETSRERLQLHDVDASGVRQRFDDADVKHRQQSDDDEPAVDESDANRDRSASRRVRDDATSSPGRVSGCQSLQRRVGDLQHVPLTYERTDVSARGSDRPVCARIRATTRKYVRDYNDCDSIEQINRKKDFLDSIEPYTGKTNINDWLDVYANYVWLANIPENVAASWIFSKLKGAAKEWAKSPDVRNLGDMSWKDVVKSLRERFESADERGTRSTQLFQRVPKPDETLVEFAEDMYRLRSIAFGVNAQAQFSDDNLIDLLIAKLDKYLRYQLRSKEVNTWAKLKHELRLLDDINGKDTHTVLFRNKDNRDDTRRERENNVDTRSRSRGRFEQRQRRSFNNYARAQSEQPGPRPAVAMFAPVGVTTDATSAISMAPPMNTVLCVQPSATQSIGGVQQQTLQQAPMVGTLNSNAPAFQPNVQSSNAQPQPTNQSNLRRCKFCWEQGWGECYHRSWRDCPYKIMQRSQHASNGQASNGGPQSDVPIQPQSANAIQQGARPSDFNPNRRRQGSWQHKRGRGPENNPQTNGRQQQQQSRQQNARPNDAPPLKMFKTHLVLRIGSKSSLTGIESSQRSLRDVRRILTTRVHRQVRTPTISEEKMEQVVRKFIDADPRAFDETTYASLNACVLNDLADAWSLDVTNNQFTSFDTIKTLLSTPISAPEAQGRLIIPRWSNVVDLRRLLNDKDSGAARVGLVIPMTLLPIFEDQRIDIPILLSRARNLFCLSAVTTRCGITRLAPCGNAEKLFRRCTWIAILVSNDKRRCTAFARAFGDEEAASIEQLRMHMRILKHSAYLPGYEPLDDIQEVDEPIIEPTPVTQTQTDVLLTLGATNESPDACPHTRCSVVGKTESKKDPVFQCSQCLVYGTIPDEQVHAAYLATLDIIPEAKINKDVHLTACKHILCQIGDLPYVIGHKSIICVSCGVPTIYTTQRPFKQTTSCEHNRWLLRRDLRGELSRWCISCGYQRLARGTYGELVKQCVADSMHAQALEERQAKSTKPDSENDAITDVRKLFNQPPNNSTVDSESKENVQCDSNVPLTSTNSMGGSTIQQSVSVAPSYMAARQATATAFATSAPFSQSLGIPKPNSLTNIMTNAATSSNATSHHTMTSQAGRPPLHPITSLSPKDRVINPMTQGNVPRAIRSFDTTKVPRPDMRVSTTGTPVWMPGYVRTPYGLIAHPIPFDTGSPLSLISANLSGTFFQEENIDLLDDTLVMGIDGQSVHILGTIRLWFELPDWRDPHKARLTFEDQLMVIDAGLTDLILLGNELIGRAKLNIQPAEAKCEWIIHSPHEPFLVMKAFSDERECLPVGEHYRVRTPSGVKMCAGRRPKGTQEPEEKAKPMTRPTNLAGLVAIALLSNIMNKYNVDEDNKTDAVEMVEVKALPTKPPTPKQVVNPHQLTSDGIKRLIERFGLRLDEPIDENSEVGKLLADQSKLHINPDVPQIVIKILKAILVRFGGALSRPSCPMGTIWKGPPFRVRLNGTLPSYVQQTYTFKQREELRPLVQQMYDLKVLADTDTATYACRVSVVRRTPTDKPRLVTNYRPVNEVTVRDIYPIALTTENIKWLLQTDPVTGWPRCNYMSDFDANRAYWQVPCADQATKDALAMALPDRVAACERMPFGPCNAPGHWSRVCDAMMGPFKWINFTNFYDNLHCAGPTLDEALFNVALIMERMEAIGMTVDINKCHFFIVSCDC